MVNLHLTLQFEEMSACFINFAVLLAVKMEALGPGVIFGIDSEI